MCGGDTCTVPMGGGGMLMPCCVEDTDECGFETLLAPGTCLPQGAPGGIDPSCPPFDVAGFFTWDGCCTPEGQCGALDSSGTLGCIPNSTLGAEPQSCTYNPDNTCRRLLTVSCDGPEDCGDEEQCCGRYASGYREFHCAASCAELEANSEANDIYSVACHPGQSCETPDGQPEYTCKVNETLLPPFLFRCRDTGEDADPAAAGSTAAGEVNCGDDVCGFGQKCCVPIPGTPRCIPVDADCTCTAGTDEPDGGTDDGGT